MLPTIPQTNLNNLHYGPPKPHKHLHNTANLPMQPNTPSASNPNHFYFPKKKNSE